MRNRQVATSGKEEKIATRNWQGEHPTQTVTWTPTSISHATYSRCVVMIEPWKKN